MKRLLILPLILGSFIPANAQEKTQEEINKFLDSEQYWMAQVMCGYASKMNNDYTNCLNFTYGEGWLGCQNLKSFPDLVNCKTSSKNHSRDSKKFRRRTSIVSDCKEAEDLMTCYTQAERICSSENNTEYHRTCVSNFSSCKFSELNWKNDKYLNLTDCVKAGTAATKHCKNKFGKDIYSPIDEKENPEMAEKWRLYVNCNIDFTKRWKGNDVATNSKEMYPNLSILEKKCMQSNDYQGCMNYHIKGTKSSPRNKSSNNVSDALEPWIEMNKMKKDWDTRDQIRKNQQDIEDFRRNEGLMWNNQPWRR